MQNRLFCHSTKILPYFNPTNVLLLMSLMVTVATEPQNMSVVKITVVAVKYECLYCMDVVFVML